MSTGLVTNFPKVAPPGAMLAPTVIAPQLCQTTDLIVLTDGEPRTTTLAIAEGTGAEHASVIKLVRNYQKDIEEFGLVRFEIRPRLKGQHGGGDVEYALLNEQQATLIIAFMRNTEIVVDFKKRLVKAFYALKAQVAAQPAAQSAFPVPKTFSEALLLAATQQEQIEYQGQVIVEKEEVIEQKEEVIEQKEEVIEQKEEVIRELGEVIAEQAPKVSAWEKFLDEDGLLTFTDLADNMGVPGLSAKRLCAFLRDQGYLTKQRNSSGRFKNMPSDKGKELSAFKVVQRPIADTGRHVPYCKLTKSGADTVRDVIQDYLLEHSTLAGNFKGYRIQ